MVGAAKLGESTTEGPACTHMATAFCLIKRSDRSKRLAELEFESDLSETMLPDIPQGPLARLDVMS